MKLFRYFRTNLKYRLIAIFLAVIIWLFVFEEANPTQENVINVPLETQGLQQGYVIADKPTSVNVRIQGRKPVIEEITSQDLKAYVKMSAANIGNNSLPVYIDLPQGVKLIEVEPTYADVSVDSITSIQLPVTIKITGTPQQGYKLGEPQFTPDQIMVMGPRNVLENIEKIYADVHLTGENEDYYESLPLKIENDLGEDIYNEWVTTRPEAIEVFIPIISDNPTRSVPVTYQLEGKPAQGYEVTNVEIYPKVVEISSSSKTLLQEFDYVPITIDLQDNDESLELEIPLELPEGITSIGVEKIKAFVTIEQKN